MFSKALVLATISVLSCSTAWSQGGSPPGGGGTSEPPFTGNFNATQLFGYSNSLFDRILAENIHGTYQIASEIHKSLPNPPMITVLAADYRVGMQILTRSSGVTLPEGPPPPPAGQILRYYPNIFSGQGATGYWNGTDPGWTILPNNVQAGGYYLHPAQIVVELAQQYAHGPQPYRYTYNSTWRSVTYTTAPNGHLIAHISTETYVGESEVLIRILP